MNVASSSLSKQLRSIPDCPEQPNAYFISGSDQKEYRCSSSVCLLQICTDIRLLANLKEIEEPFEKEQIGMLTHCSPHTDHVVSQLQVVSLASRLQRHALQEEPHARRALLQLGPAPGGTDDRPAADRVGPVAGEDAGRQRQQVGPDALMCRMCETWRCGRVIGGVSQLFSEKGSLNQFQVTHFTPLARLQEDLPA